MLSRSHRLLARQNARVLGKHVYRQSPKRLQSTASTMSSTGGMAPYVAAGAAGGALVVASGYAWYHFSGLKTVVDASKSAKQYMKQAHASIKENAKNTNEALAYLRQVAKTYVGLIPGISGYVDATFDAFDELVDKHRDEVNAIAQRGYEEIQAIVSESGGKVDLQTATKVMKVLQQRAGELQDLAGRAGAGALEPLFEKYPGLREKLGGGYQQFAEMVERQGPEAKRILDDTKNQVMEIFSKGMSTEAASRAQELIQSKIREIRKLAESSARQAWDSGLQQAQPYLDKLPELRETLEENANKFIAAGAAALPTGGGLKGAAKEVFDRIREVAESKGGKQKEKVEELKRFVNEKAQEAEKRGKGGFENEWGGLASFVERIPGGEEALEKTPNVKELIKVSQEHSNDAKQLAKETYQDILRVLEEKGQKAKRLAEEAKKDTE